MDDVLLDVRHLTTEFITEQKRVTAVNDVSFQIRRRETFGLIGESGCGKSVTCRSLLRILKEPGKITGGEILLDGTDLAALSEKELRKIRGSRIGMIFQEPMTTLNPVETIGSQIMEAFRDERSGRDERSRQDKQGRHGKQGTLSRKEKKKRAVRLMELVGIPSPEERLAAYPHQFSGGMRQRAMIAIALASSPELLLADEPTTALDVTVQKQIIRLLQSLQKELGMSVVIVTHDLCVASEICDRIAVMYAGRIMETADAEEVFAHPLNPYTYDLLKSMPSVERKGRRLYSIEGTPPALDEMTEGCPFAPRCEFAGSRCRKEVPELTDYGNGHFSRCFETDALRKVRKEESGHG